MLLIETGKGKENDYFVNGKNNSMLSGIGSYKEMSKSMESVDKACWTRLKKLPITELPTFGELCR